MFLPHPISLLLFAIVLAVAPCCTKSDVFAQDESNSVDEVPTGALWRFGDVGTRLRPNGYYRLAFSRNGNLLAARNLQNEITIIDVETRERLCSVGNDASTVLGVDFSPDDKYFLATAPGNDVPLRVFESQTGTLVTELGSDIGHAYFSKDGDSIFALGSDSVQTYSWPTGELLTSKKWRTEDSEPHAMSRDGNRVVASYGPRNQASKLLVYDLDSRSTLFVRGHNKPVKSAELSPDKLWLAITYHRDPHVRLWDLRDPRNVYTLAGHSSAVQTIAFSFDSRFLISTSWDKSSIVWDVPAKKKIGVLKGHKDNVNSSAFSPLKFEVATGASGANDNSIIVWDLWQLLFPDVELPKAYESFEIVWKELGSELPRQSLMATRAIIERENKWLNLLTTKVISQNQNTSGELIDSLVDKLSDKKFAVREEATLELIKYRGPAERFLKRFLESDDLSAEARHRITRILRQPVARPKITEDELRRLERCVLALELIETDEAIDLLSQISKSHLNVDISRSAYSALDRIARRQSLDDQIPVR